MVRFQRPRGGGSLGKRQWVDNSINQNRCSRITDVGPAVGVSGEAAIPIRKSMIHADVKLILDLHPKRIDAQVIRNAGQVRQWEDRKQVLRNRVNAAGSNYVTSKRRARVGGGIETRRVAND